MAAVQMRWKEKWNEAAKKELSDIQNGSHIKQPCVAHRLDPDQSCRKYDVEKQQG